MALTVPNIIQIAKVSQYLGLVDINKGTIFSPRVKPSPQTAKIIYMERKALEWMYDSDPTNESLRSVANYVYALCNKYVLEANVIVNGSSGGGVVPTPGGTPSNWLYVDYYITAADVIANGFTISELANTSVSVKLLMSSGIGRLYTVSVSMSPFSVQEDKYWINPDTGYVTYMGESLTEGTWIRIYYSNT